MNSIVLHFDFVALRCEFYYATLQILQHYVACSIVLHVEFYYVALGALMRVELH